MPRKVVVTPPATGKELVVEPSEIGCLDDENTAWLQERETALAELGRVGHVLDQLEHDDGIEAPALVGPLGERLDALAVGLEAFGLADGDGLRVEFKPHRMPLGIARVGQQRKEAAITAPHIEQRALSPAQVFPVEPDLSAFPKALDTGHQCVGRAHERVVVGGIDDIEIRWGRSRVQVLVGAVTATNEVENVIGGVVFEIFSAGADFRSGRSAECAGDPLEIKMDRSAHSSPVSTDAEGAGRSRR